MARTLKGLRADLGITQEQMAKMIGVAPGTYVKYEKGKSKIPFACVIIIADACGIKDLREIAA